MLKLLTTEYRAPYYWFAVMMVAIFGTMAADGIHDGAHIPYAVTTPAFRDHHRAHLPAVVPQRGHALHPLDHHPPARALLLGSNPIFAFWFADIVTRPLGASFADGVSKPTSGGLGLGDPLVSLIEFVLFVGLVTWVTKTRRDVQTTLVPEPPREPHAHGEHGQRAHGRPAPARLAAELE